MAFFDVFMPLDFGLALLSIHLPVESEGLLLRSLEWGLGNLINPEPSLDPKM